MINEILEERGNNYGSFHTQANLVQTLNAIIQQHYISTHTVNDKVTPLPNFMLESIHMICTKLGRIANGDPYYVDSWQDIAGYAQLVVDILENAKKSNRSSTDNVTKLKEE